MTQPFIVGLTGLKQSGKSVIAAEFERLGFAIVPFAGVLKAMLAVLLQARGVSSADVEAALYGSAKEVPLRALNGRSSRHAMQTLGTEWGREIIHPKLWTDTWVDLVHQYARVVVDDVRFLNEAALIKQMGGIVWRVERGEQKASTDRHPSETEVLDLPVDRIIYNIGSLTDLQVVGKSAAKSVYDDCLKKHRLAGE